MFLWDDITEKEVQVMIQRPRRLRGSQQIRNMVRETRISPDSLIYPMFVVEGENMKEEITSMPGQYR